MAGLEISLLKLRNLSMHINVGEIMVPCWKYWTEQETRRACMFGNVFTISTSSTRRGQHGLTKNQIQKLMARTMIRIPLCISIFFYSVSFYVLSKDLIFVDSSNFLFPKARTMIWIELTDWPSLFPKSTIGDLYTFFLITTEEKYTWNTDDLDLERVHGNAMHFIHKPSIIIEGKH